MPDTGEALKIWQALRPMVDKEISEQTESCVRAKKMIVKQPPSRDREGAVSLGAFEPYGEENILPAGDEIENAIPGSPVWVYWYLNNASTMHVALNGDGTPGTAVTDRLEKLIEKEKEAREKGIQDLYDDMAEADGELRSYIENTEDRILAGLDGAVMGLRSYIEVTSSKLRLAFEDGLNSLRSYVELTASHLRTEFYDDLNSLRSYVEITASHLRTEFYDDMNSLRSYVEITASHLRTEFYDDMNSLRSYVEITASHLRTEFYDDMNSLRSYVEITASHLRTEFYDDMNSLRSYVEITASHLRTEFYDDMNSLRSYVEITASHLRTEFYDDMNSLRSYVEITASHLRTEFYDDMNSLRSYVEITASHLRTEFYDDMNSLRSYVELTAEHLQIEFTDDINSLRSYVELTASHLEIQFTDQVNSLRSYVELTASHLTVQFENEVDSLRSYVDIQAGKIDMNVAKTDENASILRQAGMYINDQGVLIYATDNQNNIGSKLNVLSNEISAKVGKSEVVITDDSITIGSQSISFEGYVTIEDLAAEIADIANLEVQSLNASGSVDCGTILATNADLDYINGTSMDHISDAVYSFGTPTSSGGQISIPYTKLGGGTGSINFNIADTQFYQDGVAAAAAGVTLSGAWSSAQYTATASNGKTVSSGYVYIAGSANNAYFGNGTNLTVAADVVAGGTGVIRANDTTVYDIGSLLEANTTLTASAWDNNQSTVTAKVNGTSVGTLTVTAPTTPQRIADYIAAGTGLTPDSTGKILSGTATVFYDDGTNTSGVSLEVNATPAYNAGMNSVTLDGSMGLNSSYSPTYYPSSQAISLAVIGTLTNGTQVGGTILISGGAVQDAYNAGWVDGYNAAVAASGKSGDTITIPTTTTTQGTTPTTSYTAHTRVNDTHYISFPEAIALVPGQTFTGAAGNYVYKNSVELKGTAVGAVYWT